MTDNQIQSYMELNDKQRKFIDHFLITGDEVIAAKSAGYTGSSSGSMLMNKPEIQTVLEDFHIERRRLINTRMDILMDKRFREVMTGLAKQSIESDDEVVEANLPITYDQQLRAADQLAKLSGAYVVKQELQISKLPEIKLELTYETTETDK